MTLGGSSTAGLGYSPNVTFARYLERMARAALPGARVEVLNLGIVALATKQEKLLVAEVCRNYDPDVVIVYAGNNEFLEIHAQKYAEVHASVRKPATGSHDGHEPVPARAPRGARSARAPLTRRAGSVARPAAAHPARDHS